MSLPRPSLEQIGVRVAAAGDRALDATPGPDVDVVLAGVARLRGRARRRRAALAGAAVTALAVTLGLASWRMRGDAQPGVVATQPSVGPRHAEREPLPLDFADGTRVVLAPGATTDVREVRSHGAQVALVRGTIDVHVVHTDATRWDVLAGDFDVTVTGTRFDATWDPERGELTVAMKEGTVRVSGPCVREELSAPSHKTFSCAPAATVPVTTPASPPTSAPLPSAPSGLPAPRAAGASPVSPSRAVGSEADKPPLVVKAPVPAEGVQAGESDGPRASRTDAPKGASTLDRADSARLAGDSRGARALYAQARAERPGTADAVKAAFLLGRLAEDAGDVGGAARWYDVVCREATTGPLAQDALGRMIELEQRQGHAATARALAERYLVAHPKGPHSSYARSVLDASR